MSTRLWFILTISPWWSFFFFFKGKSLQGKLARWYLSIIEFNLTIKYIKGKENVAADALSKHTCVASVPTVQGNKQKVISSSLIPQTLFSTHDSPMAGHHGRDKCLANVRRSYYWPTVRTDITQHIDHCHTCAQFRGTIPGPSPMGGGSLSLRTMRNDWC